MHSFICNDASKTIHGVEFGGSAWRAGRWFLYGSRRPLLKAEWSWFSSLNWLEASLRIGGEDGMVTLCLLLPWLLYFSAGFAVPRSWLSWWMVDDRVFAMKFGYVGAVVTTVIALNEHADDCGMLDYYRAQKPRRYTMLQLWRGWEIALRLRPLDWIFGRPKRDKGVVEVRDVTIELDGKKHAAQWTLERWATTRARWPWEYGVRLASWLKVENPPRFAGKGENSWDCGDDAIYGMGSPKTDPGAVIGEYVGRVLEYRERYGNPSGC